MHKVRRPAIYLIIIIAVTLNLTFLNHLKLFNSKPDLLLIVAIFFATFFSVRRGVEIGLVCGVMADLFTREIFGVNTLLFTMISFFVGRNNHKFYRHSPVAHVVLAASGSLFLFLGHRCLHGVFTGTGPGYEISFMDMFMMRALPTCLYTTLIAPFIFLILIRIFKFKDY